MASSLISRAHVVEAPAANTTLVPHWGYPDEPLPCTGTPALCEYLDLVYIEQDRSMLYTFIMWAVIGSILAVVFLVRIFRPSAKVSSKAGSAEGQSDAGSSSGLYRAWRGMRASLRRRLLPESLVRFFGNVSRLQLVILAMLAVYLIVFSFSGITYNQWMTPVKKSKVYTKRTSLSFWANRVGALAYALTPLTVALSSRESLITLVTGIPYQSLNFMHRWLGIIVFLQGTLHTMGWTIVEAAFYRNPNNWNLTFKEPYIQWGCVAMVFVWFLFVFSLPPVIRMTGHEFFRKAHYVIGILYVGACWAHWSRLACWMIASLGIFGLDRGIRFLRTGLIHIGYLDASKGFGFHSAQSSVEYFDDVDGGVVRLDLKHNHETWAVGQHFFLCFPALTIWQSHPLTVASVPAAHPALPHHTYIIRARRGETGRLKALALKQASESSNMKSKNTITPVILCGPYGTALLSDPEPTNILAIAGGTGVSLTLPVVMAATSTPSLARVAVDFIWIIRRSTNTQWIAQELEVLKQRAAHSAFDLRIHIYVTQEAASTSRPSSMNDDEKSNLNDNEKDTTALKIEASSGSSSSLSSLAQAPSKENFEVTYLPAQRPALDAIVKEFMESRASAEYRTRVIASGPASMGHDLRSAVAASNDGGRVWKGERKWDVSLDWDDRMG